MARAGKEAKWPGRARRPSGHGEQGGQVGKVTQTRVSYLFSSVHVAFAGPLPAPELSRICAYAWKYPWQPV